MKIVFAMLLMIGEAAMGNASVPKRAAEYEGCYELFVPLNGVIHTDFLLVKDSRSSERGDDSFTGVFTVLGSFQTEALGATYFLEPWSMVHVLMITFQANENGQDFDFSLMLTKSFNSDEITGNLRFGDDPEVIPVQGKRVTNDTHARCP